MVKGSGGSSNGSGDKIALYDESGNIKSYAEIFVGVMGASSYIYLEATMS